MIVISHTLVAGVVRSMFALMVLLAASSASAQTYQWSNSDPVGPPYYSSAVAACQAAWAGKYCSVQGALLTNPDRQSLAVWHNSDFTGFFTNHIAYRGAQVTTTTTTSTTTTTNACASKAGQSAGEWNLTIGWGTSSSIDSVPAGSGSIPASTCVSGCRANTGSPTDCWYSSEPSSTGMYRASCDVPTTYTGATCTASAESPNPASPPVPPACAQNSGTVNGKPVCLDPNPKPTPASLPKTPLPGNPVPGSTTSTGAPRSYDPSTGSGSSAPPGSPGAGGGVTVPYGSTASGAGGTTNVTVDVPNDYNKESTQQQIRDLLNAENAPQMPDQQDRVDTAKSDFESGYGSAVEGVQNGMQADKDRFFSWVWTPQTFECTAPPPSVIRGVTVTLDGGGRWCIWAEKIRELLGWLFGLVSALVVYGQLFKKE